MEALFLETVNGCLYRSHSYDFINLFMSSSCFSILNLAKNTLMKVIDRSHFDEIAAFQLFIFEAKGKVEIESGCFIFFEDQPNS